MERARLLFVLAAALVALGATAADYPAPQEGSWVVRDFRFHTGEMLPELRLHYTTVGAPDGEPVLILHGTTGSGAGLLTPAFAGELFGPGQPLDASRYYIILPDAIGTGKSTKPSDGMRMSFPKYNYDDMVDAQYRLVTEHLGREAPAARDRQLDGRDADLDLGAEVSRTSWTSAVPMASLPTEMSGRNWMMRRLIMESIRNDPDWMNGNYTTQPRGFAVRVGVLRHRHQRRQSGALQGGARRARRRTQLLNQRLSAPFRGDANDHLLPVGILARLQPLAGPGAHRGRRCWRSTRPTTSATRRSSACWIARSSA